MNQIPTISEAEHQVMKIIWKDNPIMASDIINVLTKTTDWKPKTIKTLINRLLKKGAIGFEKSGREYNYYPLIEEADFVKTESRMFVKRLFGGSMKPLLVSMVENEDLTLEDIDELRKYIMEKKKGVTAMENISFDTAAMLGWLFESTLYISVFICLILVLKAVTRGRLPAWWSYGLWILLVFRMLLPWGIETPLSIFNFFPAPPGNEVYMPLLMSQELNIPFLEDASSAVSLDRILLTVWLAGILFFTITTLFKNLAFWAAIRRVSPVTDSSVLDLLDECRALLGCRKPVQVVVTEKVKSPGLFGYLKPRLLLPPDFLDTVKKDELQCVFYHELGHLKSHDIGISWLVAVLQVVYWFNPFVWYAFHNMRVDQGGCLRCLCTEPHKTGQAF